MRGVGGNEMDGGSLAVPPAGIRPVPNVGLVLYRSTNYIKKNVSNKNV